MLPKHKTAYKDYPRLKYNISVGFIQMDLAEESYYGICLDETETHLGMLGDEQLIEDYLRDYPKPSDW